MRQDFAKNRAATARRKVLRLLSLRCVNEYLFARGLICDRHNPVTTTTILTHDAIHKASINPTLRIDHTSILTSDHGREDSIEAVLSIGVGGSEHFLFPCGDDEVILQKLFCLSIPSIVG